MKHIFLSICHANFPILSYHTQSFVGSFKGPPCTEESGSECLGDLTELNFQVVSFPRGWFNTSDVPTSLFFRGWLFQQPLWWWQMWSGIIVLLIHKPDIFQRFPQPFRDDKPSPANAILGTRFPRVPDPSILDLGISPVSTIYNANFQTSYHWNQSFSKEMLGMSQQRFSMTHHSTEDLCSFLKQTCVNRRSWSNWPVSYSSWNSVFYVDTICEAIQKLPELL